MWVKSRYIETKVKHFKVGIIGPAVIKRDSLGHGQNCLYSLPILYLTPLYFKKIFTSTFEAHLHTRLRKKCFRFFFYKQGKLKLHAEKKLNRNV
jgi:hypothetical protein